MDYCPGWVDGSEVLFRTLREGTRWHAFRRPMYDRVVDVPRLTAGLPDDGPGHPIIDEMALALGRRYAAEFDRVGLALYRDGRDSVAFHRDRVVRYQPSSLVAIVSLGGPRRFMLRPFGGGRSRAFSFGWGDLLVMGGACQRDWEHGVPKTKRAAPRIAVMFRRSLEMAAYPRAPDYEEVPTDGRTGRRPAR